LGGKNNASYVAVNNVYFCQHAEIIFLTEFIVSSVSVTMTLSYGSKACAKSTIETNALGIFERMIARKM